MTRRVACPLQLPVVLSRADAIVRCPSSARFSKLTSYGPPTPAELLRLHKALARARIDILSPDGEVIFEKFGKLLALLSPEERALILDLTDDFLRCHWLDYFPLLTKALSPLGNGMLTNVQRVFLLPLSESRKDGKPKSPTTLLYPAENMVLPYIAGLQGKTVRALERQELLTENWRNRGPSLLVFLDDFIGSGGSAEATLSSYSARHALSSDKVLVVALVAQEAGVNRLNAAGFQCSVAILRGRGISDCPRFANVGAALALMDAIESRLGVSPEYRYGYAQTEALVSMIRTPNNTFPVFWMTNGKGQEWPAPFRRFS